MTEDTEPLVGFTGSSEIRDHDTNNQHTEEEASQEDSPLVNLDLDKLLTERLGEFGRYQKVIYFLICLPAALTAGVTLSSVFTEFSPPHRCYIPGCDDLQSPRYDDAYYFSFYNFTVPVNKSLAQCEMLTRLDNTSKSCYPVDFSSEPERCERRLFSDSVMKRSVATEFDLVCDSQWELPLSQSVFFAGVLVGAPLWGHSADLLGRRITFFISLLETSVFGILAAFSTSFNMFVVVQFFTAMGQVGLFQTAFVLGIELVGPNKRTLCGILIEFVFVTGELYLALVAWQLRDWRKVQLACAVPCLALFSYYFILPESVRWLLTKKKYDMAQSRLEKIAKRNNVEMPKKEELAHYTRQEEVGECQNTETMMDLLRRPRMLGRLLNVFFNWFVITMIYYGLSLNAASLAGDVYVNFALLSLCEVPGYSLSYLGMKFAGRRLTLSVSLLIGGVSCLISSIVPNTFISTAFFLLGKFGATAGFGTTYLYTGELFPTQVRSLCVGVSSMVGRLGAIISPYIAELGLLTGISWLPMAVFAGTSLLSGLLTLLLPETRNKTLPTTVEEAENI